MKPQFDSSIFDSLNTTYSLTGYFTSEEQGRIFVGIVDNFFAPQFGTFASLLTKKSPTYVWLDTEWKLTQRMNPLMYFIDLKGLIIPIGDKTLTAKLDMGKIHFFKNKQAIIEYLKGKGKGSIERML